MNLCPTLTCPVILIHGWTDVPAETGTWKVVEKFLNRNGIHFFVPAIARYGTIEERSQLLIKDMASLYQKNQAVHLIGHSLGGLVAREIAGREELPFRVLSVTTLGSPNRGLRYLDVIPVMDGTSEDAATIRSIFGTDFGGLTNLSCKFMNEFNQKTKNNPDVKYFSWAGEIVIPTVSYAPHWLIVARFYTKSDGIVGVETAKWDTDLGPGTHLGTVAGLTHSSIVCLEVFVKTLPHLRATELGSTAPVETISRGFRDQLARRVVGHKSAFEGRLMAWKDTKRHGSGDGSSGYAFDASHGYKYAHSPTGSLNFSLDAKEKQ
ncbi:Alpha/Beta hydrolase protein [Ephemerocybe angulata]|uniref:Alpha/Beta hydrolase protein n=1 Tax=Ephemerocybe angulata TaxID=980116 RepID=A0A8H6M678_9AGAR|nr:Alpha/Beta hydrolase protein [Tulosesus angulatus]